MIAKAEIKVSVDLACEFKINTKIVIILIFYFKKKSSFFCEKGVLRNFTKFTGKHLCQSLFFNKVLGLGLQLY